VPEMWYSGSRIRSAVLRDSTACRDLFGLPANNYRSWITICSWHAPARLPPIVKDYGICRMWASDSGCQCQQEWVGRSRTVISVGGSDVDVWRWYHGNEARKQRCVITDNKHGGDRDHTRRHSANWPPAVYHYIVTNIAECWQRY